MSSASQWRARRQAMRSKISLALLMGAAAAAACSGRQQGPPTIIVSLPTSAPTVTIPATTAPTEAPTPVAPTETPEGSGGGGEGVLPVLLADMKSDPAQVAIVHPVTGAEQGSFVAPGLTELSSARFGGPFLFYLDTSAQMVKRADFDGNVEELRFVTSGTDAFQGDFLPSPDGTLIAWGTSVFEPSGGNATHVTLKVANVDGSDEKTIVDDVLQNVSILPQPIQWSADGKSFYYTDLPYGIGGYILFAGGPDLKHVDLEAGTVAEVLPDMTGCLCPMTVSPDGATVAYIAGVGPLELVLRDIATGEERKATVDPNHLQAGNILWSPDGATLFYTMAISSFEDPANEKYAVVRVDAATLTQTIVIPDGERLLNTILWPEASTIWLNDALGNSWRMNAATGEVTLVSEAKRVVGSR